MARSAASHRNGLFEGDDGAILPRFCVSTASTTTELAGKQRNRSQNRSKCRKGIEKEPESPWGAEGRHEEKRAKAGWLQTSVMIASGIDDDKDRDVVKSKRGNMVSEGGWSVGMTRKGRPCRSWALGILGILGRRLAFSASKGSAVLGGGLAAHCDNVSG